MYKIYPKNLYILGGVLLYFFALVQSGQAAGFQLYEQGQPSIGSASVGQAALADDASTSYFNPAGMTRLKRSEILLGSQLAMMSVRFHADANNTRRGNDGGQAGGILPAGGFYLVYKFLPEIAAGLSINAPVGLGIDYNNDWYGRYLVQNNFLAVADISPVVSLRLTDWLCIGGGADIYYAYLKQESALFNPLSADGQIKMSYDDWAIGYNLGVLVEPSKKTRIGLAYRSQVDMELTGDIDFVNPSKYWTLRGLRNAYGTTNLTIPMSFTLSLYQEITDKFAIVVDGGWQNWSSMEKTIITTENGIAEEINRDWNDTWRAGGGIHYRIFKRLLLKAGISYDSNPVSEEHRLPDIPVDRQWRYATGVDYAVNEDVIISLSWEYIDMGKAPIDHQLWGHGRRLSGDYDQFVNVVSLSFRWKFGK